MRLAASDVVGELALSHPLADEWVADHAVYRTSLSRVVLSASLRDFIDSAHARGRHPVLLSGADAWVSWHVLDALRNVGGSWLTRDRSGALFNACSGRCFGLSGREVFAADGTVRMFPGYERERGPSIGAFFFDGHVRQRAEERTRIGRVVEHMLTGLGAFAGVDAAPARWGLEEPLGAPWDPSVMTGVMRGQMLRTQRFLAASGGGAAGVMRVERKRVGLMEHVRGVVPAGVFGAAVAHSAAGHVALLETLTELSARFRPVVMVVSYGQLDPMCSGEMGGPLGQRVGARAVDVPVGVLLGPGVVRDLAMDFIDLARRHDVTKLGPGRVPSALIRFSGEGPLWQQFRAFAGEFDPKRIGLALRDGEHTQAGRVAQGGGGHAR